MKRKVKQMTGHMFNTGKYSIILKFRLRKHFTFEEMLQKLIKTVPKIFFKYETFIEFDKCNLVEIDECLLLFEAENFVSTDDNLFQKSPKREIFLYFITEDIIVVFKTLEILQKDSIFY